MKDKRKKERQEESQSDESQIECKDGTRENCNVCNDQRSASEWDLMAHGALHTTKEHVKALKKRIKGNPDELDSRLILIEYFTSRHRSRAARVSVTHFEQLKWMIENHPASPVLEHHCFVARELTDDQFNELRECWMRQVDLRPTESIVFTNAASFLQSRIEEEGFVEIDAAIELLKRAAEIDQCNHCDVHQMLSHYYGLKSYRENGNSSLRDAVKHLKIALEYYARPREQDVYLEPYFKMVVCQLAERTLQDGLVPESKELGQILLNHHEYNNKRFGRLFVDAGYSESSNLGKAVLGRVAILENDVETAKEYLEQIEPAPDGAYYFHYQMVFVEELIEQGETECVSAFLKRHQESLTKYREFLIKKHQRLTDPSSPFSVQYDRSLQGTESAIASIKSLLKSRRLKRKKR